jgi:hypothetical protein
MILLEWSQPFGSGSGRWNADVSHRGLCIEVTAANNAVRRGVCPCAPEECNQPGVPAITVYARAQVPMLTSTAGAYCWLAGLEQPVHVADADAMPDETVTAFARILAATVAESGRVALAELARHAARLGITPTEGN